VFSAAERSITGERIRQFDADELVAFVAGFRFPLTFFFVPPAGVDLVAADGADEGLPPDSELLTASRAEAQAAAHDVFEAKAAEFGIPVNPPERSES
jgi:hypothetical protein